MATTPQVQAIAELELDQAWMPANQAARNTDINLSLLTSCLLPSAQVSVAQVVRKVHCRLHSARDTIGGWSLLHDTVGYRLGGQRTLCGMSCPGHPACPIAACSMHCLHALQHRRHRHSASPRLVQMPSYYCLPTPAMHDAPTGAELERCIRMCRLSSLQMFGTTACCSLSSRLSCRMRWGCLLIAQQMEHTRQVSKHRQFSLTAGGSRVQSATTAQQGAA